MKTSSTNDARPDRWRILSKYREGERTLTEWTRYFAGFPPKDFPLVKIVGSRAGIIRCPDTEIPLSVYANVDGSFSARPPPDIELDTRFDGLTIEEVRLYRLDWPALCREVVLNLGLTGQIRDMPDLRWFWRLGDLHTKSQNYVYFFAVIREDPDADIIGAALKSNPMARLLVPSLSDPAFHRLAEAKMNFHVLADGTPPHFPDVATPSAESPLTPSRNETTPALARKLDAIEDKTDRVLMHVAGVPPLVEKAVITKRVRGKDGGRTPNDGQEHIKKAVAKVLELRDFNKSKSMTMERACKNAIKEMMLSIKWQALAKQVRQSPKWEALKKRINITRK